MKTQLLAVALGFALSLILSCSSNDIDDGLYLLDDGKYYNGDGDIKLVLMKDTLPAGKIQDGQVTLSLPNDIDSNYLDKFLLFCETDNSAFTDETSCESNIIASKKDIFTVYNYFLLASLPGKGECLLEPREMQGFYSRFIYFSESGEITGSETGIYGNGSYETITYDLAFSRGWNMVHNLTEYKSSLLGYYDYVGDINHDRKTLTTNPNVNYGEKLGWQVRCM